MRFDLFLAVLANGLLALVRSLSLKILPHFGHSDKNNPSFISVKILRLFVCNHNKTLRFCKIKKANSMPFLPSQSPWNWARNSMNICLIDMKNISIESNISTFKWTNSNGKQIFSDYVICMKIQAHAIPWRWRVGVADFISWAEYKESTSLSIHY